MVPWVAWETRDPHYLGWFALGWLLFLPQEYLTHVFILHAPPPRSSALFTHLYRLHYGHHDLPCRSDLMYMPLWLVLPMLAVNLAILDLLAVDTYGLAAALSGLFAGYLVYEWSHLYCHIPGTPKTALGRLIRERHRWHHWHSEHAWFSVSAFAIPFDRLFGTAGDTQARAKSGSTRFLGVAADDPRLTAARTSLAGATTGDLQYSRIWLDYLGRGERR
jgi:hypothetical protein